MSNISDELAKKKARLAELRRAKEARLLAGSASATVQSVDQILASVGIAPAELPRAGAELGDRTISAPASAASKLPAAAPDAVGNSDKRSGRAGTLSMSDAIVLEIPGRSAVEVYEKVTQTDIVAEDDQTEMDAGTVNDSSTAAAESPCQHVQDGNGCIVREPSTAKDQEPPKVEVASDAEWAAIQRSEDFGDFFWKSTKVMERALGLQEVYDILKDYAVDRADDLDKEERSKVLRRTGARVFFAPLRCAGRPVTCLEWSPHHPELVIAAYYLEQSGSGSAHLTGAGSWEEGEGLVCVWNTRSGQCEQPEYVLACEAVVTALCAHPHSPHCFVGGTCVGQIVVWDLRASARPVARSPLSCSCHIHPIVGVEIIGSHHAHR